MTPPDISSTPNQDLVEKVRDALRICSPEAIAAFERLVATSGAAPAAHNTQSVDLARRGDKPTPWQERFAKLPPAPNPAVLATRKANCMQAEIHDLHAALDEKTALLDACKISASGQDLESTIRRLDIGCLANDILSIPFAYPASCMGEAEKLFYSRGHRDARSAAAMVAAAGPNKPVANGAETDSGHSKSERFFTAVFKVPVDWRPHAIMADPLMTAVCWSHAIHARDDARRERDAAEAARSRTEQALTEEQGRLDWVLADSLYRVQGSDTAGWSVCDCHNGLTFLVERQPTGRAAIDATRTLLLERG